MSGSSYSGKVDIAATNTYATNIYSENTTVGQVTPPPPLICYFLLLEDGDEILLENNDVLELECQIDYSFLELEDGDLLLYENGDPVALEI